MFQNKQKYTQHLFLSPCIFARNFILLRIPQCFLASLTLFSRIGEDLTTVREVVKFQIKFP